MAKANSIIALVFLALTFIFSIITIAMVGKGYQDIKDLEHVINYMDILNLKDANIKGSAAGVLVVAIISSVVSLVAFILTLISTSKSSPTASGKPKIWGIVLLVTSLLWIISMLAFSIIAGTKRFQVGQGKNYDSLLTGSGGSTMTGSTSPLRSAIVIGSRSNLGDLESEKRELEIAELLERFISPVQKRADDDDEDNDDDSDSSSDSTSTTSSASTTDDGFGSSITDSGIYNSGGGVSNMYGANMPKYIKVRSSKRIIGLGWVAFAFTTITGFLLLLLPLKNQGIAHETGTTASPEMATREVSKEPEEV